MTAPDSHLAVLKRMTKPRHAAGGALPAWRAGADRLLRDLLKTLFKMDAHIWELDGATAQGDELIENLEQVALPFLLERGEGEVALLVLDGALIDGLIEQQLLGEVLPTPRLDRPVTAIDAGLSEGFALGLTQGLTRFLGGKPGTEQLTGWSLKAPERDRAALALALPDGRYEALKAMIDMGPGLKSGRFTLWLPFTPERKAEKGLSREQFARLKSACTVELTAKMRGGQITLAQIRGLEVDGVVPLEGAALSDVVLVSEVANIKLRGRLGQLDGRRAFKADGGGAQPLPQVEEVQPLKEKPPLPEPTKPKAAEEEPTASAQAEPSPHQSA